MTAVAELQNLPRWRRLVLLLTAFLGLFTALCTVLMLVVSAAEGWIEHAQAQWPKATARVQSCALDIYTYQSKSYWIDCTISYQVGGQGIISHVHSRPTPAPSRVIWQYPSGQFQILQEWVDKHPEGTAIDVHYDPANHNKAVLVTTDMPLAGPRTPYNLTLLGFSAASCVVLLTIARIARPQNEA
jgi:hypothetical protein